MLFHHEKQPDSPSTPPLAPSAELDDLPIYIGPDEAARSRPSFCLRHGSAPPWLTLTVSSGARESTSHPLFFDGAAIDGAVRVVLDKPESIHAVKVVLQGWVRLGSVPKRGANKAFTSISAMLYKPDVPGNKLAAGTYNWPFTLQLPHTVNVENNGKHSTTMLPPTYKAPRMGASLEYHLHVFVRRSALSGDDHLKAGVIVLPRSRPKPALTVAYTSGSHPVGLEGDATSWQSTSGKIVGKLFSKLEVEIDCTFSLAKPLLYARETAIPFHITFTSNDAQALDVFSQPCVGTVQLEQTVSVMEQAVKTVVGTGKCFDHQTGRLWRRLQGEIPVARDLKPAFSVMGFALSYAVTLTIDATGFVPAENRDHALVLSHSVGIATDRPRGPCQPVNAHAAEDAVPQYIDVAELDTIPYSLHLTASREEC